MRAAEVLQGQGETAAEAIRQLGVTEQTFYRWRKGHGGTRVDQARRLKELAAENARLRSAVADLAVDKQMSPVAQRFASGVLDPDNRSVRDFLTNVMALAAQAH